MWAVFNDTSIFEVLSFTHHIIMPLIFETEFFLFCIPWNTIVL